MDARQRGAPLTPIWRFFGADEPNYATMKDGRRLLGELGALRTDDVYFRAHNLLSSGDGTPALKWGSSNAYTEDAQGNAVYDWRIIDGIFDAYLANGVRPFVQLGFMPQALSSAPPSVPYKHSWRPGFNYNLISGGWGYPPRDYDRWSELCYRAHPAPGAALRRGRGAAAGGSKPGTSRMARRTGRPAPRSSTSCTTTRSPACAARCRARVSAGRTPPVTVAPTWKGFLDHITTGKNYATGETGTPTDFLAFHAKGAAGVRRRSCPHGHPGAPGDHRHRLSG